MSTLPALLEKVRADLDANEDRIAVCLPVGLGIARFKATVITALSRSPQLINADRQSLINACVMCASDGLLLDGREAVLTIFKTKTKDGDGREVWIEAVQYMPMVDGILKLLRNAGEVNPPVAAVVCRNDVFRYWTDDNGPHLLHEPAAFGDRGEMVGVYATARGKDGSLYIEVMSAKDVAACRKQSKSPNSLGWTDFPDQMWIKSAIHRLAKRLPTSPSIQRLLSLEEERDEAEGGYEALDAPSRPALSDFTKPALPAGEADDGPHRVLDEYGAVEEYAAKSAAVDKLRSMLAGAEESTREALRDLNPDLFDDADHVGAELGLPPAEETIDVKALWEKYLNLKDAPEALSSFVRGLQPKAQRYVRRCMEQDGLA